MAQRKATEVLRCDLRRACCQYEYGSGGSPVCKGSAWAYTLRVTPTCWHHDFVIVTAGSDLATLAALCIYCTQRLCHDAVKYQYGTRTPVSPGAAQQQAADFGALDLREAHGAAVARGQP